MSRVWVLAGCLVGAGCGRIGFDERGLAGDPTGDGNGSGSSGDGSSGGGVAGPSCSGLASTCGSAGTAPCCTNPLVPGGTFYRSYDIGTDSAYPNMSNPATVSDFRLDTYEVTVGRFRQFVNVGTGTQQNPPPSGAGGRTLGGMANQGGWSTSWNASLTASSAALVAAVKCDPQVATWTDAPGANESLPMNCVTWFEAMAFCAWDGGFLPTEAEWNYAATGGSEQRAFPWSVPATSLTVDCSHANGLIYTNYCANPVMGVANRVGSESPLGDGKWGHADLAGNLAEWTLDWYASTYGNPCNGCADLTAATNRVIRGGGFGNNELTIRAASRASIAPTTRSIVIGLRCARAP